METDNFASKINPLVTVVVITYNHSDFLRQALDSALAQITNFKFIVLIADDHSTDGTREICEAYKFRHPDKIELQLNEQNLGAVENCRRALSSIRSQYFAAIEGDDYWTDPHKLQIQVDDLNNHKDCSMAGHNTTMENIHLGTRRPMVRTSPSVSNPAIITLEDKFRVHTSSRLYRNVGSFKDLPDALFYDTGLYMLFLSKGKLAYRHQEMSVYRITGKGSWSGLKRFGKAALSTRIHFEKVIFFGESHDAFLLPRSLAFHLLRSVFGRDLTIQIWYTYIIIALRWLAKIEHYLWFS
jgi:glycosyltransferase involved in cell wall biosynthesis